MKNMLVEDMYQRFVHLWKKKHVDQRSNCGFFPKMGTVSFSTAND